jgi:hypothetical protein
MRPYPISWPPVAFERGQRCGGRLHHRIVTYARQRQRDPLRHERTERVPRDSSLLWSGETVRLIHHDVPRRRIQGIT